MSLSPPLNVNGPTVARQDLRNTVFMGFAYDVGEGNTVESMAHRSEALIDRVYANNNSYYWFPHIHDPVNPWDEFRRTIATDYEIDRWGYFQSPEPVAIGLAHFPPNAGWPVTNGQTMWDVYQLADNHPWLDEPKLWGAWYDDRWGGNHPDWPPTWEECSITPPVMAHVGDYDRSNPGYVQSTAPDWRDNFPNLQGAWEWVNEANWLQGQNLGGGLAQTGDHAAHFICWWYYHMPHITGTHSAELRGKGTYNVLNNWYEYIFNFNAYDDNGQPI